MFPMCLFLLGVCKNKYCLFVRTNAVEFARHAFPMAVIVDMEATGSHALSYNMSYAAAQTMFYLVAGARRIQLPNEMEAAHSGCGV